MPRVQAGTGDLGYTGGGEVGVEEALTVTASDSTKPMCSVNAIKISVREGF